MKTSHRLTHFAQLYFRHPLEIRQPPARPALKLVFFFAALSCTAILTSAQSRVFPEWTATFDGTAHGIDHANAVASDVEGNVYVTGFSNVGTLSAPDQEMLTIKYDSSGHLLWKAWLTGPQKVAQGVDVGVDAAGDVFAVGSYPRTDGVIETATIKYNPDGVLQWERFFGRGSDSIPVKLFVVNPGPHHAYVLVTGGGEFEGSQLFGYDDSGNGLDTGLAQFCCKNGYVINANGLGVDSQERAYVALTSSFIFDGPPNESAMIERGGINPFGQNVLGSIKAFAVDVQGNSYVAGGSLASTTPLEHPIVAKFNSSGTLLWLDDFSSASLSPTPTSYAAIAADPAGNVFVAQTLPTATGSNISVLKLNSFGAKQWQTSYNGHADQSGADVAIGLAVNSFGEPYVTGKSQNAALLYEAVTIKYSTAGNEFWVERTDGPSHQGAVPSAIATGGAGELLITGVTGPDTNTDWLTVSYLQDAAKLTPATLTFQNQAVGKQSSPQSITVTNTGEQSLAILNIISETLDFPQTNNCSARLTPGASCTISLPSRPLPQARVPDPSN